MKKKQIPHWIYNSILSTCIILLQTDHKTFLILHCYIVTEGIFFLPFLPWKLNIRSLPQAILIRSYLPGKYKEVDLQY